MAFGWPVSEKGPAPSLPIWPVSSERFSSATFLSTPALLWFRPIAHHDSNPLPPPIHARAGDFVFGPKHLWHHLEPVGAEPTIRIAINARGEFHRYDRPGCKPL